ncbi:TPA: Leucine-rich repeat-containing protein 49, variant 3 [Trebouxia sp. C0004]
MKPRGQSPARRSSHVEINATITDARTRTSGARPVTAWQGSQGKGFSSLPGAFAVHGQSVKQTQVREAAADNRFRNRKLPQPSTSPDKIKHRLSDALAFDQVASLDSSKKHLGAVRAVPRSNSMPAQQSLARAQSAIHGGRAVSRSASRGRQGASSVEPQPAKSSFNGLIFKQSRQGDVLIVSRTLAARMAAPHSLHLDHLKLSECCLVEGEEQVTMLSYQHNSICVISRLDQLPQLTILDMYSNNIQSLQALPRAPSLRGLMLGRNYISTVDSQQALRSLEVLDLHNNLMETLTGLTALTNLRRLNLAGNRISHICSLSMLTCLEDLDLNRNFLMSLTVSKPVPGDIDADRTGDVEETYWPASLRKLTVAANRLATLDDLVPLQQLSRLTQLGLEGNPCCYLHPISRFRIEVLARHCTSLHLMNSHKVTSEERSLAAAMRWQDELTSRGCLPIPDRPPHSLTSLASLEPHHPALLQRADSKHLSSAAAVQAVASDRLDGPTPVQQVTRSPSNAVAGPACQAGQNDALNDQQNDTSTQTLHTLSGADSAAAEACQQLCANAALPSSRTGFEGLESKQRDAACGNAQLARLPSAKGHCLSSNPTSVFGRPQSPMKHPFTPGDCLAGLSSSHVLSVRPMSMQGQRSASVLGNADSQSTSEVQDRDTKFGQTDSRHPVVLERNTQQSLKSASSIPPDEIPIPAQQQRAPADQLVSATSATISSAADRDSWQQLASPACFAQMHKAYLGLPAAPAQHAIPERLLSSKQASALWSGIPPHIRAAKMKQQESLLQPADFEQEAWQGVDDLLCIGQGQQPIQGVPSMCPPAEDGSQSPVSTHLQQPGASAELVDGYQLHITGDAMDALQSPVCASAQEVILKGVPWNRVVWGMPMLVILQRLRKLVLIDNHLCHLPQIEGLSALVKLQHLTIRHNLILRQVLLRPYVCFCLPTIQVFNGQPISVEELSQAEDMFQALHETRLAASSQPLNQLVNGLSEYTYFFGMSAD